MERHITARKECNMGTKENIVYEFALEAHKEVLSNLKKPHKNGYQNIYFASYTEKIGKEFKANKISFISRYDEGHGIEDADPEDKKWSKQYRLFCKTTPSDKFLYNILNKETQKKFLLETFELINFEESLQSYSSATSILHILRDYKDVGVDKMLINNEITQKIMNLTESNLDIHSNIIISFIYDGFFFPEEFIENKFQSSYLQTFGHRTDGFQEIVCQNKENKVKYDYVSLTEKLANESNVKPKRAKI